MQQVILDTNMLLVPGQFKVDIFSEIERVMDEPYELVILKETFDELHKIQETASGEDKQAAKLAELLVAHQQKRDFAAAEDSKCKGLKIVESSAGAYVDDAILTIAENDAFVATNDGELKRRLLEQGVRVIFLKQQQYLTVSA